MLEYTNMPVTKLTTADLVILALLTERPRHGYNVNAELERRDIRDWASVSRPQIYYSLQKLAETPYVTVSQQASETSGRPDRQVFAITEAGREALAEGLATPTWATQRVPQPFFTWIGLSAHAEPAEARAVLKARRDFLLAEVERERETIAWMKVMPELLRWQLMVQLPLCQFEAELKWLGEVESALFSQSPG